MLMCFKKEQKKKKKRRHKRRRRDDEKQETGLRPTRAFVLLYLYVFSQCLSCVWDYYYSSVALFRSLGLLLGQGFNSRSVPGSDHRAVDLGIIRRKPRYLFARNPNNTPSLTCKVFSQSVLMRCNNKSTALHLSLLLSIVLPITGHT